MQLGGEQGIVAEISPGDVVIIPAGVSHKNLGSTSDFHVVGAYPTGTSPDMNYGKPGERPRADKTIAALALPAQDPIYGETGPLLSFWR